MISRVNGSFDVNVMVTVKSGTSANSVVKVKLPAIVRQRSSIIRLAKNRAYAVET